MYILSYLPYTYKFVFTNKYVCLTWFASIEIGLGGSVLSLFFITVDRYIAVMWPLRYQQIVTVPRTIIAIIGLWCDLFLLGFAPILLDWNQYDPTLLPLTARCNFHVTLTKVYVIIATFGSVLTTLLICTILYVHIIIVSQRQARSFRSTISSLNPEEIRKFKNRMSSVKMTSFLMLLFIVLLTPYMVVAPFKYYNVFSQKNIEIMRVFTLLLTFTNSVVNVPIYALYMKEYRSVYMLMLRRPPHRWKPALRGLYNEFHSSIYAIEEKRDLPVAKPDMRSGAELGSLRSLQVRDLGVIEDMGLRRGVDYFQAKPGSYIDGVSSSVDVNPRPQSPLRNFIS
ncbi:unnamed protein product [Lymnaea stagnalis]|uniref:G-protein coupled receptors family 1 profile domain-containing protein n=1 Tax=Lymnaea stagnalis TaxID=6523 RepID=A0AAV2HQP0_LYMST